MSRLAQFFFLTFPLAVAYALFTVKVGMAETLFAVLSVLYAEVAIKVEEWSTLSSLGNKIETPQFFMSNESYYHGTRTLLFIAAVAAFLFTKTIPWYLGVAALAAAWFSAPWIGRNLAFIHCRRIGREMVEELNNLRVSDPAEYAREVAGGGPASNITEWEKEVKITNQELRERLKKLRYMRM